MKLFIILLFIFLSTQCFAKAKYCYDAATGKRVKCAKLVEPTVAASPVPVVTPAVVPPVAAPTGPAGAFGKIAVVNKVSKKGKVYQQCKDLSTGLFTKCPSKTAQ